MSITVRSNSFFDDPDGLEVGQGFRASGINFPPVSIVWYGFREVDEIGFSQDLIQFTLKTLERIQSTRVAVRRPEFGKECVVVGVLGRQDSVGHEFDH